MVAEKEKTLIDFIKLVSPGTSIRTVIDNLVDSDLGALIILDSPELHEQNLLEGGFRINCRFTPQKLFELCKMDGAILISSDLKRILSANTLVTPDPSIYAQETGTRHKAAERTAKQTNTLTIAVSERRKKTTLYFGKIKYNLKPSEELLRTTSSALQVLEKQRELFDEQLNNLNVLEMSDLVSVGDVCKVLQQAEMILKISETIKRNFTELGKEGNIMHLRYRELTKDVERYEDDIIRDYSTLTLKKTRTLLSNLTFDGLLDLDSIARLVIEKGLEENISPRGFRFLSKLTLSKKEVSDLVNRARNLREILSSDCPELEEVLKNRAAPIREEIGALREQVLSGKAIC
jgi:diadenylate cyclase